MALRAIGIDKGKPWCVDAMANAFPAGIPGIKQERTDTNGCVSGEPSSFVTPRGALRAVVTDR